MKSYGNNNLSQITNVTFTALDVANNAELVVVFDNAMLTKSMAANRAIIELFIVPLQTVRLQLVILKDRDFDKAYSKFFFSISRKMAEGQAAGNKITITVKTPKSKETFIVDENAEIKDVSN